MISAIIIDDEMHCRKTLFLQLREYCPNVHVIEQCDSAQTGLEAIRKFNPDLVFLDIEMPHMNGFEMLEQFSEIPFALIFTTGYDQYAIKAFRFSALDYLLKPIDHEELKKAVEKVSLHLQHPLPQQLEILLQKMHAQPSVINKIAVPTMEGLQMIAVDSIISCESDRNYTVLLLKNKQRIIVSRILKDLEEMLEDHNFLRVHHSYIVNLNEISKYVKGEGGYLVMSDGSSVDVSRSRKEILLQKLQPGKYNHSAS
ncbi:MAG TPA: LytTR family DNA-binding domain-containing protein [Chitinophagaceae bacterium]|jgi:two-component system LytT family response regulator|nr:LytTR family DNA-binding domain-containing protein [Chitinophagaceae bacterium]